MGTTKNILMQEFNGVDYDTLYPSIQPDFPNDLANMYLWEKLKNEFTQTEVNLNSNQHIIITAKNKETKIAVADDYYFDESSQSYVLKNPTSITIDGSWNFSMLKTKSLALCGKWCIAVISSSRPNNLELSSSSTGSGVYKVPIEFTEDNIIDTAYVASGTAFAFTGLESTYYKDGKYTLTYYGYDLTPTHTPPTDEYSRNDLGVLCNKGFYGSYIGTGNGSAVLELQFPFQPKIVMFSKVQQTVDYQYSYPCVIWVQGTNQIYWSQYAYINFVSSENKLQMTWNMTSGSRFLNEANKVYYYWAR